MRPHFRLFLLLGLLIGGVPAVAQAQSNCGSFTFEFQLAIDRFPQQYPDCTEVDILRVRGSVVDLTPLSQLTSVTTIIDIARTSVLESLEGLQNITSVGQGNITPVGGGITVAGNQALMGLQGLRGVSSDLEFLTVQDNPSLTSLDGLQGISGVKKRLRIAQNSVLQTLSGLDGITSVGGAVTNQNSGLEITGNEALLSLTGLEALTSVLGAVEIDRNRNLIDVAGLSGLTEAGAVLIDHQNFSLKSIRLESLTKVETSFSVGIGNTIEMPSLTTVGGRVLIGVNGTVSFPSLVSARELSIFRGSYSGPGSFPVLSTLQTLSFGLGAPEDLNLFPDGLSVQQAIIVRGAGAVTSLRGLANITFTGGLIRIEGNNSLVEIGLEGLTTTSLSGLVIGGNDRLPDLSGLPGSLTSIERLFVTNNDAFVNLGGLPSSLTSIGALTVSDNQALVSLGGLPGSLDSIGSLSIRGNGSLRDLRGLPENITSIGGTLGVLDMPQLQSVDGLERITSVGGALGIGRNDALLNLDGLRNLRTVGDRLIVRENPRLAACNALYVLLNEDGDGDQDGDGVGGTIQISSNAPGCNSPDEIQPFGGNQPPVADAGPDQTLECAGPSGTPVTLDGSGSTDPDGDALSYLWQSAEGAELATGPQPTISLPLGLTKITLLVSDGRGGTDVDIVEVTVEDTTPPALVVSAPPAVLWPVNHTYHTVSLENLIAGSGLKASDTCDGDLGPGEVAIASVASDEPENDIGRGDGNTTADIVIAPDCQSVQVRAERQGRGNGRVYTLTLSVADASGNVAEATYEVQVPRSRMETAVNDGPGGGYSVTCGTGPILAKSLSVISSELIPGEFALLGSYPNPFRTTAQIGFALPEPATVQLVVYDLMGREVTRLFNGPLPAGRHEVRLDGTRLPSGQYFYRLTAGSFTETRSMTLVR